MSDTYNEPLLAKISAGSEITNNDLEKLNALFDSDDVGKISYLRRGVLEELSNKKHPQFVRHIGMVQDQLEPEYYVNQIDGKSTHFRDFPPCHIPDADIQSNLSERQPLFVVPIPWASSWLADSLASKEEGVPERQAMDTEIETLETETSRKRERDSDDENLASRQRTQCKQAQQHRLHARQQHNGFSNWWPDSSPNPNSHCPVIAKFYFDHSSNEKHGKLRLNDLVETIGIVSINPWEADFSSATEDEMLFDTMPPPPSQIPRLHVLAYRKIDLDDLASKALGDVLSDDFDDDFLHNSQSLASQALFMSLLSKAERKTIIEFQERYEMMQRTPSSAIGCLSLQISTSTGTEALYQQLKSLLQSICPVVACVDLSSTREKSALPAKVDGRIEPTPWQLPRGATLLIHQGELDQYGQALDEVSLEELLRLNRISYSFDGGVKIPFDADYRIIVVSNKSLKCTLRVNMEANDLTQWENLQSTLRKHLALCRKTCNVKVPQEVLEKAQEDFLVKRSEAREDQKRRMPGEEDFHRWLSITRLMARKRRADASQIEDWDNAFAFDHALLDNEK